MHPGLAFNAAGDFLATSCKDDHVRLFRLGGGEKQVEPVLPPFPHTSRTAVGAVFRNDGKTIVTVEGDKLRGWDVKTGEDITPQYQSRLGYVLDLSSSADGRWVAAGGNRSAMVWKTDGEVVELEHTNNVTRVVFLPDSSHLMTVSLDRKALFWQLRGVKDLSAIRPEFLLPKREWPHVDFSTDGHRVVLTDADHAVIWNLPKESSSIHRIDTGNSPAMRARMSFDGHLATFGAVRKQNSPQIKTNRLTVIRTLDGAAAGPPLKLCGRLIDSCVCADNQTVAAVSVASDSGYLQFFNITSGDVIGEPILLPAEPHTLDAHPVGDHVVTQCCDGSIVIADRTKGAQVFAVKHSHWTRSAAFPGVMYSPDGKAIVDVDPDQRVYVRDAETGELRFPAIRTVTKSPGLCRSVAVSPNSCFFATAVTGENYVRVWDMQTGKAVGQPMPHSGSYYGLNLVQFSPDGRLILTGHENGELRLWNWKTGELVNSPMQNPNAVTDATFSGDGKFIIAAIRLGTIQVWNTVTASPAVPAAVFAPKDRNTSSIAVDGSKGIASTPQGYYLLNLDEMLKLPQDEVSTQQLAAELASQSKLQEGVVSTLSFAELQGRWFEYMRTGQSSEMASVVVDPAPAEAGRIFERLTGLGSHVDIELFRLSHDVAAAPDDINSLLKRAALLGRIGRWRHAANDALRARAILDPQNVSLRHREPWGRAAEFLILAGDFEEYDRVCEEMVTVFRDTNAVMIADTVCKAALLKPGSVIRDGLPIDLVMRYANEAKPVTFQDWFRACCVLIAYRQGDFDSSILWAQRIRSSDRQILAITLAVQAMAEHQLECQEQAVRTLKTAENLIPRSIRGLGTDSFQGTFPLSKPAAQPDWYVAEILRQEAEKLILGQ